jgi:microcin C transport system substrate-binding protein
VDDIYFRFFYSRSAYIKAPWLNDYYTNFFTNITRYDDYTFSITIPEAKPDIIGRTVNLSPAPEHFYKELGEDFVERYQWRFVPTTGPYVIHEKDLKKGRSIALTRNDDWWMRDNKFYRNRFNFDKIRFNVIRDTPKALESFKRGELDRIGLTVPEYWYDKLPDTDMDVQNGYIHKSKFFNVHPRPTYGLWINSAKPLLDNLDVRIGINYATNFQLVIDKLFRGDPTRMKTTADGFGEFTHPTLQARDYDIDKALEHFARAGFTTRNEDGILINEHGQKLSFTLSSGYEVYKDVFTILREEALKAGLEFRIEVLDGTSGWKKVQEKKHDIHFVAFGVGLEMYPRYWETYHSDNAYDVPYLEDGSENPDRKVKTQTNNFQIIADPKLDAMIESYRHNEDKEDMKRLAFEMEQIIYDHASFIPGWVNPFYRTGHWRWLKYPEGKFAAKHSQYDWQLFSHWIDTDIKTQTKAAMKSGETFPPEVNIYDQHKEQ